MVYVHIKVLQWSPLVKQRQKLSHVQRQLIQAKSKADTSKIEAVSSNQVTNYYRELIHLAECIAYYTKFNSNQFP